MRLDIASQLLAEIVGNVQRGERPLVMQQENTQHAAFKHSISQSVTHDGLGVMHEHTRLLQEMHEIKTKTCSVLGMSKKVQALYCYTALHRDSLTSW